MPSIDLCFFFNRSQGDKEKQVMLAEKRAAIRKKAAMTGDKLKQPADEKGTVNNGKKL